MTAAQKTTLLRRLKQGAFWLAALLLPGGSLLALVPWLRTRLRLRLLKGKDAPCEGC